MSELNETWAAALAEAEMRARASGRTDIAEYIALRASNDMMRSTGIDWLLTTFVTFAGEANRDGASISFHRDDSFRFPVGAATMVGTQLTFRLGVRALHVEAGWPRTPRDGIVRGGGLACARIRHFGDRASDQELLLLRSTSGSPQWFSLQKNGERSEFGEAYSRLHLAKLLGN